MFPTRLLSSLLTGTTLLAGLTFAQAKTGSVGINTDGSTAALLDVKSITQGVLIP